MDKWQISLAYQALAAGRVETGSGERNTRQVIEYAARLLVFTAAEIASVLDGGRRESEDE